MRLKEIFKEKKLVFFLSVIIIIALLIVLPGFFQFPHTNQLEGFPDFITKNEDYFVTHIGDVPQIDSESYILKVWGEIDEPRNFTLSELQNLTMLERTLTTECIGNRPSGPLLSTAVWKGFLVYDLVKSLGLKTNATGVKYRAADGYYASHTLDQLQNNHTLGALYMNGEILPSIQGFPLRIVNPGAYGAKQPAWVVEIEVINRPLEDYWDARGWDTSPPMDVDSKIFFPYNNFKVNVDQQIEVGGSAFGGTRILKVEYTLDFGENWIQAPIIKKIDEDHVWVFWKVNLIFTEIGTFVFNVKATDIHNRTQPRTDITEYDGINSWSSITIQVLS